MARNHISIGNCGEYFVAAELERHGFTVALPLSNVEKFDILAIERSTQRQIAVQVKTTQHQRKEWILSEKNESIIGDDIFYRFVSLSGLEQPNYYIVPSTIVAAYIKQDAEQWLHATGRKGQEHKYTPIRKFRVTDDTYKDNWTLLMNN